MLDLFSASSLKQQYAGRHVAPRGHINPIPSQPVFVLNPYSNMTSRIRYTNKGIFE